MDPGKPLVTRTQRLFLALWPDAGVREQLVAHASQWTWPTGCNALHPIVTHITDEMQGDVPVGWPVPHTAGGPGPLTRMYDKLLPDPSIGPKRQKKALGSGDKRFAGIHRCVQIV